MGSRILSRSFQVEAHGESVDLSQTPADEDAEMSLGEPSPHALNDSGLNETEGDEDSDDDDDSSNVAMVPLADMLNARYGCENVRVRHP
jgi:SET domain-containing protein 6